MSTTYPTQTHFKKGDRVEVSNGNGDGHGHLHQRSNPIWHPATVLSLCPPNQLHVVFDNALEDYVPLSSVRPLPPVDLHRCYKVGDSVDAFQEYGWRKGVVKDILVNSKYLVRFEEDGIEEEDEVELWRIRVHRDWVTGSWVPLVLEPKPLLECFKETPSPVEARSKEMKLKIKLGRRPSEVEFQDGTLGESPDFKSKEGKVKRKCSRQSSGPNFRKGTRVEVKSDEEGYHGSWFTAVVIDSVGNDSFLVEYQTLKTEVESEQLKEIAYAPYIRHCPPEIYRLDRFKMLEEVDVWYNDGWWVGIISKVLTGMKYKVYFWTTNEELESDHFNLRPHQEWMDGKWVASFLKKTKAAVKPRIGKSKRPFNGLTSVVNLIGGLKVEIGSDEEGYRGLWYPAVVIKPARNGKYLVQYQSLRTDDDLELLKEEVDALSIRPCPPICQRVDKFKPLDKVDAWYKNGWWEGEVCKVLEGSNYSIYLRTTSEVLEFQHFNLRPHRDWIDRQWIVATRGHKDSQLMVNEWIASS